MGQELNQDKDHVILRVNITRRTLATLDVQTDFNMDIRKNKTVLYHLVVSFFLIFVGYVSKGLYVSLTLWITRCDRRKFPYTEAGVLNLLIAGERMSFLSLPSKSKPPASVFKNYRRFKILACALIYEHSICAFWKM